MLCQQIIYWPWHVVRFFHSEGKLLLPRKVLECGWMGTAVMVMIVVRRSSGPGPWCVVVYGNGRFGDVVRVEGVRRNRMLLIGAISSGWIWQQVIQIHVSTFLGCEHLIGIDVPGPPLALLSLAIADGSGRGCGCVFVDFARNWTVQAGARANRWAWR